MVINRFFLLLLFPLLCAGCAAKTTKKAAVNNDLFQPIVVKEPLLSINIIDRNGLSETVSAKERIKQYENVNFLSPQGYQKVLRVYTKDKEGNSRSIVTSYHTNGQIRQYLEVLNGRAYGNYCEWHENGQRKLLAKVISGVADVDEKSQITWGFDGICRAWDDQGRILTQIPYDKGLQEGIALYYHTNGVIARQSPYKKGEIDGEVRAFSESGLLIESTFFQKGILQGDSLGFWPDGKPAWKEHFTNGLLKDGIYFNKDGTIVASVANGNGKRCIFDDTGPYEYYEYKEGNPDGEVIQLENNKYVICRYTIKNGEKHGQEIRYYPPKPFASNTEKETLQPKLSIDWYQGQIHGFVKTWYDTGTQESQKEMSQNRKQGTLTAWYRNASLMLIEEYERDKLIRGEYLKKDESRPVSRVENGKGTAMLFDGDGNFYRKVQYQDGKPIEDIQQ